MTPSSTLDKSLEQALHAPQPLSALRALVSRWLEEGVPRETAVQRLEDARNVLRAAGREEEDDLLLEVLDFVVGWCSPHMRLEGSS